MTRGSPLVGTENPACLEWELEAQGLTCHSDPL